MRQLFSESQWGLQFTQSGYYYIPLTKPTVSDHSVGQILMTSGDKNQKEKISER